MQPSYKGKVRDVYDLGDKLLLSSSDRISAFDCILNELIPNKGKILNHVSNLWFQFFSEIPNHIISSDFHSFPKEFQTNEFKDRATLVKKCKRIDFECVVRGYLSGSGYKEFKQTGTIAGVKADKNYLESEKLSEPLFTPAVKNDSGHDENISEKEMENRVGTELFKILKNTSLKIYTQAENLLKTNGLILCDTKFEFGLLDNQVILIDELLTPDSSRYWAVDTYKLGISPPSFDKQILRNYLESTNWDKNPPPPSLPNEIIQQIQIKYKELEQKIESCLLAK